MNSNINLSISTDKGAAEDFEQAEQPQCCPLIAGHLVTVVINSVKNGMALKGTSCMRCNFLFSLIGKYALIADKGFMQNCAHSAVPRWKRMISSVPIVVILAQDYLSDCNTLNFRSLPKM